MSNDMTVNDLQLLASDIRQLESANEITRFFARLGYNVDGRINIPDYAVLGLGSADLRQQIHKIELIGHDPADGDITIYLLEVRSVTAKLRNDIARRFRDRPENALLVLTKDYEQLEFVLLERVVLRSQNRGQALKQTIRPIPLTLNRLNPEPVALRVLKRFTFTEEDAAYQWEKLRSAYMLAEWSEEYFNNRALFSDYYLNHRLTDPKITPEWAEDVRPIGRAVYGHLVTARKEYTRKPEQAIRSKLYEPLFQQLGFVFVAQKSGSSSAETPDYLLYAPGSTDKPIAAALTYVWNRNLDDVDEARELTETDGGTPFEIPGALVVSLLEAQVAPWVIVTNGKLWRLYSATASNKATNYYEVDLEEAIAANDQRKALQYWWLLFRRQAFTGFLDTLLKNSADYAKELGERLKDRVFVEIFPQFAKGFIADMRAKDVHKLDDAELAQVFSGTMTFLYRLMFLLYAESLELLPVHEANGYRELSLYQMKREIAETGGTLLDESPDKLGKRYAASSTALYERLNALFAVINQGSDELNMPTYNGGLFSSQTDGGQFLDSYAIPDRFLALGLDRLARDVDARTKALVFIDFKSLGVRQLGSIYEGLLEFKLKIANEPLAVTKEKGKEIYVPFAKVKKPLTTIEKGDVYLENDKKERKATGSYYTPDYIVKYIVQHTVGPVLDRAFEQLTPRLRTAQKGYRDYARLAEARSRSTGKPESPAVYWNNPDMQQLVDECLNIRCLDPAMGSGHFLVEVVDYVSNRLISFLNGWSENPVWAFIERTRDDILGEMDRQHVTIDAERLTRVALLKRAVLKRCVYGVDLNAMAVELAKVSLWLDAFTLGAPLSFLDHHLKHGNSLIGARVKDVQTYLESGDQIDMFSGSKFTGVMLATDLMRQVSFLSDNTVAQTQQSAAAYRDASDHLAPYKRLLDVYTSRWFGNIAKKGKSDYVRLFLQEPQTEAWLQNPATLLDNRLIPADTIAETALRAAEEQHFFHWELEFPEVFFAPSIPGGSDVQLREGGGFDAVVGNPPYSAGRDWGQANEKTYLNNNFAVAEYQLDLYQLFIESSVILLAFKGIMGLIIPDTWTQLVNAQRLRNLVLTNTDITHIVALSSDVFPDASVDTMITVLQKSSLDENNQVKVFICRDNLSIPKENDYKLPQSSFQGNDGMRIDFLTNNSARGLLYNLIKETDTIGYFFETTRGINAYDKARGQSEEVITTRAYHATYKKDENYRPELMGSDVGRHEVNWNGDHWIRYGNWLAAPREPRFFDQPKLLVRKILSGGRVVALVDDSNYYVDQQLYIAIHNTNKSDAPSLWYSAAILNSTVTNYIYINRYRESDVLFPQITVEAFTQLPIRRISFTTPTAERAQLTQHAIASYDASDNAMLLAQMQAVIDADKTDVVHDLLAHLAQRMIDLNKQKQAEVKRFLGWLEARLKIRPDKDGATGIDSLPGRTVLQGYLGDYQKGESEQPWREFHYRLHQNRNRFAAALSDVEGEIEREYERSLATLLPIKRELARTDTLIDKIVYKLYGLTDAEIELIERPQYEQALTDAKAQVVADKQITDDEVKIDKIAESILPAAERFFERVVPKSDEETLDQDLPSWRALPPAAPTFLLTGDYNLRTLPEQMDFSSCIIPYTKAVEVVLFEWIFAPFRATSGYTDVDCKNSFLKDFMVGKKHLTLGSFGIILKSTEPALRTFISSQISDAANRIFGATGAVALLNDEQMVHLRNKAAHDEVLTRIEAQAIRAWALSVLSLV